MTKLHELLAAMRNPLTSWRQIGYLIEGDREKLTEELAALLEKQTNAAKEQK